MTIQLRDYQAEAIDGIYEWFGRERSNPLIVVPTGGGKSVILAEFIRRVLADFPHERILCVTHVKELIEQNEAAMLRVWPECPTGVYSASIRRREKDAQVLFAGVHSIYKRPDELGWFDLAIVDEAHLIPHRGMGMYRTLFRRITESNANLKVIGLTATPFRTGSGRLDRGEGAMFGGVAYECEVPRLIHEGWLSDIRNKGASTGNIDTKGVKKQGGDYVRKDLARAANVHDVVKAAVDEMVRRGADRKSWLVFCCGIGHANSGKRLLVERGITCESIYGNTDRDERAATIEKFRAGEIRCVVNVNVLTTGFDAPNIDMIGMLRPTLSPVLYVQMVGRGLRIAEGKEDCLLLDFAGNIMRHGPINAITGKSIKKKKDGGVGCDADAEVDDEEDVDGELVCKRCPECDEIVPVEVMECPACGHEWVAPPSAPHKAVPDEEGEVILEDKPNRFETLAVTDCTYEVWVSRSGGADGSKKPPTMRVTYWCGLGRQVSEWVCLEHPPGTYPRQKAAYWWGKAGGGRVPSTIDEAVVRAKDNKELGRPYEIVIDNDGDFPRVISVKREQPEPGSYEPDATPVSGSVDLDDLPF